MTQEQSYLYQNSTLFCFVKKWQKYQNSKQNCLKNRKKMSSKNTHRRICMIKSCQAKAESSFVSIPAGLERRKKFCEALGISVSSVRPGDRLCRRHFRPSDFGPKFLKRTAVPSLHLVRSCCVLPQCFEIIFKKSHFIF